MDGVLAAIPVARPEMTSAPSGCRPSNQTRSASAQRLRAQARAPGHAEGLRPDARPPGIPDRQEYRPRLRTDEPIDRCERPQVAIPSRAFMADSSLCVRISPDRRRGLGESQRPSWMAGRLRVQPHRSGRLHQGAPQPASSPHDRSPRIRQCWGAAGIPCAAQGRAGPVAISTRSIRPTKLKASRWPPLP